ncbi:MAG: TIGR03619 family F420-dependent LLM class oxidoreductase [Deltaproteobacteria bacterium]|nr:TIGR03619 family F420-dependent LLM class oxidoreductase [Deltaproteobacteria bacterium]
MKLGLYLRNMGPHATASTLMVCARAAEDAGIDDLWVADHIAIPPDDAEGSGGRYLDPLATLAYLAGGTQRIGLGTGVLVLPYRPALATAKWIATIQELSGGRLRLGVGAGWMAAEFRAVGVARARRGALTDTTLAFLHRCFASDVVEANGQSFLVRPRPPRPPIFVGGMGPHALRRAVRFGDGWMPMGGDATALAPQIAELQQAFAAAGKPPAEVVVLTALPLEHPERTAEQLAQLAAAGATRVVHGWRYTDAAGFARAADALRRAHPAVARGAGRD